MNIIIKYFSVLLLINYVNSLSEALKVQNFLREDVIEADGQELR